MISAIAVEKPSVAWPAAKVEIWPIGKLTANPRNARIHGPEQIEQIRASLREFGWTMPVLVRESGMLIAGHGRLEAAKAGRHHGGPDDRRPRLERGAVPSLRDL